MRGDVIDGYTHGEVDITHEVVIIGRRPTRDDGASCKNVIVISISPARINSEVKRLEDANDADDDAAGCAFVKEAGCGQAHDSVEKVVTVKAVVQTSLINHVCKISLTCLDETVLLLFLLHIEQV